MNARMDQAPRPAPLRETRVDGQTASGLNAPATAHAAQRANAGPHASSLQALQSVVAQRACADCETVERTMGGAPVQRAEDEGGLPADLRAGLESLSGRDLSGVRVNYNSSRPGRLNAHAVAQGRTIDVAPGQERHLPHEGWHAVQQMQNRVRPTMSLGGTPVNDDAALEREADVMGARAMAAGGSAQLRAANRGAASSPRQAAAGAPLQRAEIQYGSGALERYSGLVTALGQNEAVAALIARALAGGDITLRVATTDDTRYDRGSRTIYVAPGKNINQARAAILFELNNAANPHTHTNAAEGVLTAMGAANEDPGSGDYLHVAREMEKDEFISLVNYAHQAEGLGGTAQARAALREKYEGLLAQGGGLDYDAFVAQNRHSGHTLELAQAQHQAFAGSLKAFPGIPLEYSNPTGYDAYQRGTGSSRVRGQIEATLIREAGEYPVDGRFTAAAPAWNPGAIVADYHQPLAVPRTLGQAPDTSTATTVSTTSHGSHQTSGGLPSSVSGLPDDQLEILTTLSTPLLADSGMDVTTPAPRRVGPSELEQRLGISFALSPEEIEADLALIRSLS